MPEFGFSISKGRTIDFDLLDSARTAALEGDDSGLIKCMDCGTCTATCSAGAFSDFSIRKIHTMFRRGQYDGVAEALSKCMLCGKCTLVCPRSVNLRHAIIRMRQTLRTSVPDDDDLRHYLNVL